MGVTHLSCYDDLIRTCSHRPVADLISVAACPANEAWTTGPWLQTPAGFKILFTGTIDSAAPDSRTQWFIFAAAFMISACTTGMMSAM